MLSTPRPMPSVAILLCTYNGARFLPAQLASFAQQTFANWRLIASDDGSSDETRAMLSRFREEHGSLKVEVRDGPRHGFVANFLSLACDAAIEADYFAYADQDDIWDADKLSRALAWLQKPPLQTPALYCSRAQLIDETGRACGLSPLFKRKPSFRNALVQSIAGGNTMVFNEAARHLLADCGNDVDVPLHDWWTYLLVTAAGGPVHYDPLPSIRYRTHSHNVVGTNVGWASRLRRLQMLKTGDFERWSALNIAALGRFRPRMTSENRPVFDVFCDSRKRGFLRRQIGLLKAGLYRQTLLGNLGLILAVWAKKI
jgi:glycosyltransferase involved in cell wall biosynthesis